MSDGDKWVQFRDGVLHEVGMEITAACVAEAVGVGVAPWLFGEYDPEHFGLGYQFGSDRDAE